MSVSLRFEPDFSGVNQVFNGLGERWALDIIERFSDVCSHLSPDEVSKIAQAMSVENMKTEEQKQLQKAFAEAARQNCWLMIR